MLQILSVTSNLRNFEVRIRPFPSDSHPPPQPPCFSLNWVPQAETSTRSSRLWFWSKTFEQPGDQKQLCLGRSPMICRDGKSYSMEKRMEKHLSIKQCLFWLGWFHYTGLVCRCLKGVPHTSPYRLVMIHLLSTAFSSSFLRRGGAQLTCRVRCWCWSLALRLCWKLAATAGRSSGPSSHSAACSTWRWRFGRSQSAVWACLGHRGQQIWDDLCHFWYEL